MYNNIYDGKLREPALKNFLSQVWFGFLGTTAGLFRECLNVTVVLIHVDHLTLVKPQVFFFPT